MPLPSGHSITGAWALTLNEARVSSILGAYVLAGTGLGLALAVDLVGHRRTGIGGIVHRAVGRGLLIVTVIGGTGALSLYDPVTAITGVRP